MSIYRDGGGRLARLRGIIGERCDGNSVTLVTYAASTLRWQTLPFLACSVATLPTSLHSTLHLHAGYLYLFAFK